MKPRSILFLATFFILSFNAVNAGTPIFKARSVSECDEINPEMSQWFEEFNTLPSRDRTHAPIEKRIGPVKKQMVGWCFAFASADMLSYESGKFISGAHVAKNYYEDSKLAFFKGVKEGGVIKDALEINLDRPLCDESGYSSKIITDWDVARTRKCVKPVAKFTNYKVKSYKAEGHFDGFKLFPKLDEILSEGRIAGIHYDVDQLSVDKKPNSGKTLENHASTIVARYFDRTQSACRYIIRNTNGYGCSPIKGAKTQCINGYYSVTETQLNAMLIEVVSLKSAK